MVVLTHCASRGNSLLAPIWQVVYYLLHFIDEAVESSFFSTFEQSLSVDMKAASPETDRSIFLHLGTQDSGLS